MEGNYWNPVLTPYETCTGCCDTNNHTRSIPSSISRSTSAAGASPQRATLCAWFASNFLICCSSSVCVTARVLETFALSEFVPWISHQWAARRQFRSNSLCRSKRLTAGLEEQLAWTPRLELVPLPLLLSAGARFFLIGPSYRRAHVLAGDLAD